MNNLEKAKAYAKKQYTKTGKDQRLFLYFDRTNSPTPSKLTEDFITEDDYYHGWGMDIPEKDVYAEVFFGSYPGEPPAFSLEFYS